MLDSKKATFQILHLKKTSEPTHLSSKYHPYLNAINIITYVHHLILFYIRMFIDLSEQTSLVSSFKLFVHATVVQSEYKCLGKDFAEPVSSRRRSEAK